LKIELIFALNIPSRVKLVRALVDELYQELTELTPEQLELPRACGQWTVAEVIAHLARGAESYETNVRRAVEGRSDPPPGSSFRAYRASASAGIYHRTVALRRELGEQLIDRIKVASMSQVYQFESLQPSDWERPAFHTGGVLPAHLLINWRIAELAAHRWDIMHALGRPSGLPSASFEPIVDWLPRWLTICFEPGDALASPLSLMFDFADPLNRSLRLTVWGDRFEAEQATREPADAVLRGDPETLVLMLMGRLPWASTLVSNRLVVEGDQRVAERFTEWFGAV
jgi:uncharacterized protein (TIGR03083 family)